MYVNNIKEEIVEDQSAIIERLQDIQRTLSDKIKIMQKEINDNAKRIADRNEVINKLIEGDK